MRELPQRLHEAAGAHRPDRERMLARVERAMAAGGGPQDSQRAWERPPAPWMRVTAVAAAVAGAIGLGGLAVGAVGAVGDDTAPGRSPVASADGTHGDSAQEQGSGTSGSAASRGPAAAGHGTEAPGRHGGGATAGPGRSASPPADTGADPGSGANPGAGSDPGSGSGTTPGDSDGTVGAPGPQGAQQDNGVSAIGTADTSNPYWTQSDVKLTSDRELTSLTVELRIARTDQATGTGSYCDSGAMSVAISTEGEDIVFRWTLDQGRSLPAGSYTFAGQFQHAQGERDTGGDSFTATGDGPGGGSELAGHY